MKPLIMITGIIISANYFAFAQGEINQLNLFYKDSIHGHSAYRIVGIGKDTTLQLFERDKIILTELIYNDHPSFDFQYEGKFTFSFGARQVQGEQRAYYNDDNGNLVHTNDIIYYTEKNTFNGKYYIDTTGMLIIEIKESYTIGNPFYHVFDETKVYKYYPRMNKNEIVLTKEK